MSYPSSRPRSILIGSSAFHASGTTPVLMDEDPRISQEGWDTMTARYVHRRASFTPEEFAAAYPPGAKLGSRNWWVTGGTRRRTAPGLWIAEVDFKGWGFSKGQKIQWKSAVDSQGAEGAISGPWTNVPGKSGTGVFRKVQTHEAAPAFNVQYLSATAHTAAPDHLVGREATGLAYSPMPVPADSIWTALSQFTYHFPNGWVLMDLDVDFLPGTTVGLVTESYRYVRPISP